MDSTSRITPTQSLRESFSARRNSLIENKPSTTLIKRSRVASAPLLRAVNKPNKTDRQDDIAVIPAIQRRQSLTSVLTPEMPLHLSKE